MKVPTHLGIGIRWLSNKGMDARPSEVTFMNIRRYDA